MVNRAVFHPCPFNSQFRLNRGEMYLSLPCRRRNNPQSRPSASTDLHLSGGMRLCLPRRRLNNPQSRHPAGKELALSSGGAGCHPASGTSRVPHCRTSGWRGVGCLSIGPKGDGHSCTRESMLLHIMHSRDLIVQMCE